MRRCVTSLVAIGALLAGVVVPATANTPALYEVGAAVKRIDPDAPGSPLAPGTAVRKGGSGLGDGSVIPSQVIGPGGLARDEGDHISARAIVIGGSPESIAMVTVETQGMFAAYEHGIPGLIEIAEQASARIAAEGGSLPAENIVISNNHTHSGPDLIGAWGFVPHDYARFVGEQTVEAIVDAWRARRQAVMVAGADYAHDLIYNMTCTEALNQSPNETFPNTVCNPTQEHKDSWLRVLQARATSDGSVIATVLSYAAHATLGGGRGLHGDWPAYMSERLSAEFGGVGIAFQGAVGRTQPCRPRCSFTDKTKPGYDIADRVPAYTTMLMYHVRRALTGAPWVTGPIAASKTYIRHQVTNPFLYALVTRGGVVGAPIARSLEAPWTVGNTVRTVVSALRVGSLLITGAPGEAYPNIPAGVSEATNLPPQRTWTLGLADDQLGYLIAPAEAYPLILSQVAVNDNSYFSIDPGMGDHVMCAQIRMAAQSGFPTVRAQPRCVAWDAVDAAGDPLGG